MARRTSDELSVPLVHAPLVRTPSSKRRFVKRCRVKERYALDGADEVKALFGLGFRDEFSKDLFKSRRNLLTEGGETPGRVFGGGSGHLEQAEPRKGGPLGELIDPEIQRREARIPIIVVERHHVTDKVHQLGDNRLVESSLAREIVEHPMLGHRGPPPDLVEAGRFESLLSKDRLRGLENRRAGLAPASLRPIPL